MKLLNKFFVLLMIGVMTLSPAAANYAAFREAEEAFRAGPKNPAVGMRMLELAQEGILHTTGYVDYFASLPEADGGLPPAAQEAWRALPQARHAQLPLLRALFDISRVLMSFQGTLEKNSPLRIRKKDLLPTLQEISSQSIGQAYFWLHQFATQNTILGKPNTLKPAAQESMRGKTTPSLFLAEALRLGAIAEAYPIWDTAFSLHDALPDTSRTMRENVTQALRLKIWLNLKLLKDPHYLSSSTLYEDIVKEKALGVQTLQLFTASALLGNTEHQNFLHDQLKCYLEEYQAQEATVEGQINALEERQQTLQGQQATQMARIKSRGKTTARHKNITFVSAPSGSYLRGAEERSQELLSLLTQKQELLTQRQTIRYQHARKAQHFALWDDIGLFKNAPSTLYHTGESLWAEGKHIESRPYFERLIATAPTTPEAATAHARLAALAAQEGREEDVVAHTNAARDLFLNPTLFAPDARPRLYSENALLAADSFFRQNTPTEAITIWHTLVHGAQEASFHISGRPLQLATYFLARGQEQKNAADIQRALTLLGQYALPATPSALESLLVRYINGTLVMIKSTTPDLLEDDLNLIPDLIAYGAQHNPSDPLHHLNALGYYTLQAGDEALYHRHALTYLRLMTGLSLKDLWNMPSQDFRDYLQARLGSDPERLASCASILNQLGHTYFNGTIPSVSRTQQGRRAVALFKKAAQLQDPMAMLNLGLAYQRGLGGLRASTANAIGCLEIAKKFAPNDVDILRNLGLYYKLLYENSDKPENKRLFFEKAVSNWEEIGTEMAVEDRLNLQILRVFHAREEDAHLESLSPERYNERAVMVKELLRIVEMAWASPNLPARDEFLILGHAIQVAVYWDTPPEGVEQWSKRLRNAVQHAERTRNFDFMAAFDAYMKNPQGRFHKEEEMAAEIVEETAPESPEDDADAPLETGEEADADLYEDKEAEDAPATPETPEVGPSSAHPVDETAPLVPTPIFTKHMLKQFTDLFTQKMGKSEIDGLIKAFDRENGTQLWEWYGRKSHNVHGKDTFRGVRNRCVSAIKLFQKYANITPELVGERLARLTR